jgi:DNA-binding MarR family transcriptional regulator
MASFPIPSAVYGAVFSRDIGNSERLRQPETVYMNKKLALLRLMAEGRGWYSAADLKRELKYPEGSVSAYIKDLSQAGFITQRAGDDGKLQYHCRLQFEGSRNESAP